MSSVRRALAAEATRPDMPHEHAQRVANVMARADEMATALRRITPDCAGPHADLLSKLAAALAG